MGRLFSAIFHKAVNFCEILFAFLDIKHRLLMICSKKERIT